MPTHETEGAGRGLSEEIERLRETNARLNRRAQIAEAAINELANGTGGGKAKAVAREIWTRCEATHERHCQRAEQAEAERDRPRAQVAACEALAEAWDDPDPERGDPDKAEALRDALSDPAPVLAQVKAEAWDEGHSKHAPVTEWGETPCECSNPYDRGGDDGRA